MSDRKLIHAFTAPGPDAPPFINISRAQDGSVRVIVRGAVYPNGMSGTEEITVTADVWDQIIASAQQEKLQRQNAGLDPAGFT